jgi:fibronectin type 3 domain-containing protein
MRLIVIVPLRHARVIGNLHQIIALGTLHMAVAEKNVRAKLPPLVPSGLSGTADNGRISLTWGTVSGANGYNLWQSTNNGANYQSIAIGLSTASYVDTNAVIDQTNYYKVTTINNYEASANSAAVGIFLPLPALNIVSPDGATIMLSWPSWANWNLYYTTDLTPPIAWLPVTNSVTSTNS